MDAYSFLKTIPRYNIMAESFGISKVKDTTVNQIGKFIKRHNYRGNISIDNSGELTIELSNPIKIDLYEELIFNGEDIFLYTEYLDKGKSSNGIKLTNEQASIKFSIYNNKLSMLDIFRNSEDSELLEYAGVELLHYLNVNSDEVFILDFNGVGGDITFKLLEELISSYMGQDIYLKLKKITISNASKPVRTIWYDFVESYKGR